MQLAVASDHRRTERPLRLACHRDQRVAGHRVRLALQLERPHLTDLNHRADELQRLPADQHLARLGRLFQAGSDVDRITCREPLLGACHDRPGVHADPSRDPEVRKRGAHLNRRTAGPERIVLVCHRHSEDSHHGIADELLHRPAVALDDSLHPREIARQQGPQRLRIRRLAQRRRTCHIAEHHGHRLAHLARRPANLQQRTTHIAEASTLAVLGPATCANRHETRLEHERRHG